MRPNNFFIMFRLLRYMPYIALVLLIAVIAIWIIFGIKKFKWAKVLAIVLTVLVVIFGLLSVGSLALQRLGGNFSFPQDDEQFRQFQERGNTGLELNVYDSFTQYRLAG